MPTEIERKFLVTGDGWRDQVRTASRITQAYLAIAPDRSVRIRLRDGAATLTVKTGEGALERTEVEVTIDAGAAEELLRSEVVVGSVVDKTRHLVPLDGGLTAEVDEFHGANAGLVLAEVELPSPDAEIARLPWFGVEVTDDPRYLNANLAVEPLGTEDSA